MNRNKNGSPEVITPEGENIDTIQLQVIVLNAQ